MKTTLQPVFTDLGAHQAHVDEEEMEGQSGQAGGGRRLGGVISGFDRRHFQPGASLGPV
jgi:hypothetical protein